MKRRYPVTYEINENGCHICTSHSLSGNGYPQIMVNRKNIKVMKYLWIQKFGEYESGLYLLHSCDDRRCINLEHIRLGTQRENVLDMFARGRAKRNTARGSKNYQAKLTEEDVAKIRTMSGMPNIRIAEMYGVTNAQISNIKLRKQWKHVAEVK